MNDTKPTAFGATMSRSALALTLAGVLAVGNYAIADSPNQAVKSAAEAEGLIRLEVKGVDHVYARRGANLSGYKKIVLDPIEVAFRRDWDPKPAGRAVSVQEKQELRQRLAHAMKEAFIDEVQRTGRYQIVEGNDAEALRVKAEIRDLYINAPDLPRAGRVRSYTLSTGEMTLVAELRDAGSGDLIARIIDRERDPDHVWLELTTSVTNEAAARRAAAHWAELLREQLDAAHAVGS